MTQTYMQENPQILRTSRPSLREKKNTGCSGKAQIKNKSKDQTLHYQPAGKLRDKKALITGGDNGIGRAVALLFAREGADIAISFLPEEHENAIQVKEEVEEIGRRCLILPGDLASENYCKKLIEETVNVLGGIDILVSNAAYQIHKSSLLEISFEEFDKTFRTNVYSYFHLVRAAEKYLQPGSSIIATSSEAPFLASRKLPGSSPTEGAINTLTKNLAQMFIAKGIRVNAIAPGPIWNSFNPSDHGFTEKKIRKFGENRSMGRSAQPEELAPSYVFLASDADSGYITGSVLVVTGGEPVN